MNLRFIGYWYWAEFLSVKDGIKMQAGVNLSSYRVAKEYVALG